MPRSCASGTHEGREIELLASGAKPLAVLSIPLGAADEAHDEWLTPVRPMIEAGQLLIQESTQIWPDGPYDTVAGTLVGLRHVTLCRADQAWRIPAWRMLEASGDRMGWDEAHERMSSFLLGYGPEEIDRYITDYRRRRAAWASITVCWAIRRRHLTELEALAGRAVPSAADKDLPLVLEPETRLRKAARWLADHYGDVVPIRFALVTRFALDLEQSSAPGPFSTCILGSRTIADLNASLRSRIEVVGADRASGRRHPPVVGTPDEVYR